MGSLGADEEAAAAACTDNTTRKEKKLCMGFIFVRSFGESDEEEEKREDVCVCVREARCV